MSAAAAIAALGVLLGAAAIWELAGSLDRRLGGSLIGAFPGAGGRAAQRFNELARRLGVAHRIREAGLEARLSVTGVLTGKAAGAVLGGLLGVAIAPTVPGRLAPVVAIGLPVAGFLAPDVALERAARRRRRRLGASLPDALDVLAVGVAVGRSPAVLLGEIAEGRTGPLAVELSRTAAELECGVPQGAALASLRARAPGPEVGRMAAALERSARHGSPLAEQLRQQATAVRRDQRRRIEESAARSAPKIQLVVALILVPSVLALITAALLAHLDLLLVGV